jgi:hypothetical protein
MRACCERLTRELFTIASAYGARKRPERITACVRYRSREMS